MLGLHKRAREVHTGAVRPRHSSAWRLRLVGPRKASASLLGVLFSDTRAEAYRKKVVSQDMCAVFCPKICEPSRSSIDKGDSHTSRPYHSCYGLSCDIKTQRISEKIWIRGSADHSGVSGSTVGQVRPENIKDLQPPLPVGRAFIFQVGRCVMTDC